MKRTAYILSLLVLTASFIHSQQENYANLSGPYLGQKEPGTVPEKFAPGIISSPEKNEFCASFSPDGKEFYFNRGMKIMVCSLKDGRWSSPEPVKFSSGFRAHEAHITFDNSRVYWGWFKDNEYAMYFSERVDGGWSEPRNAGVQKGYSLTSDRSGQMYMTRQEPGKTPLIARVIMKDGLFADMIPIEGEINKTVGVQNSRGFRSMAHPAIAPDGSYILFDCNGGSHLWVTFRNDDNTWSEAVDLSKHGIGSEFGLATVSRDGKFIFLSGNDDIYWVSTKIIEGLRPKK